MTEFRRSRLAWAEWPANVARQLVELGWFARNVLFKALILGHRRDVALRLGLEADQQWPH